MKTDFSNFPLKEIVADAINQKVKEIADEEYKAAVKRIEERKSAAIADVVLRVQDHVSYERIGTDLRIVVKKEQV